MSNPLEADMFATDFEAGRQIVLLQDQVKRLKQQVADLEVSSADAYLAGGYLREKYSNLKEKVLQVTTALENEPIRMDKHTLIRDLYKMVKP